MHVHEPKIVKSKDAFCHASNQRDENRNFNNSNFYQPSAEVLFSHAPQNDLPQKFSYAFMAQKKPQPKPIDTNLVRTDTKKFEDTNKENHSCQAGPEKSGRKSRRSRSNKSESEKQQSGIVKPLSGQSENSQGEEKTDNAGEEGEGKKKRKRKRKRKRKKKDGEEGEEGATEGQHEKKEVELRFEDEEEFPDLMASATGGSTRLGGAAAPTMSYSAMLKSVGVVVVTS